MQARERLRLDVQRRRRLRARLLRLLHPSPRLLGPSPRPLGGIPHPGLLTVVYPSPPPPRQVHASDYCINLAALSNARVAIPAYVPPPPPQIRTAAAERTVGAARRVFGPATTTPSGGGAKHTVAFVMSDGDNLQWILGPWTTDERWWGATERGSVPLGWTLSPAIGHVAPYAALERRSLDFSRTESAASLWYLPAHSYALVPHARRNRPALALIARGRMASDELVAAPSGVGYVFPQTWPKDKARDDDDDDEDDADAGGSATANFVAATAGGMAAAGMRLVNVLGQNDDAPDAGALLSSLLADDGVDGAIYYGWGGGYSSLGGDTIAAIVDGCRNHP